MFKSRKRKFTKTAKKRQSSSSDEAQKSSIVRADSNKIKRKNHNKQTTGRYLKVNKQAESSSSSEAEALIENRLHVHQDSKKSGKITEEFHGIFSNKDRYEVRKDQDWEALQRKTGKQGFDLTSERDNKKILGAGLALGKGRLKTVPTHPSQEGKPNVYPGLQQTGTINAKNAGHAVSYDDCIDPTTGEKRVGYRKDGESTGEVKEVRINEGELMYKGNKAYTDWNPMAKKDPGTKLIRAVRGPVRAPTFMRVTTRWDYEKVICRDWKECGYCVFGDCCKYIHDRSDMKNGWELEDKFKEMNNIPSSDGSYTVSDLDDDDEDLPFRCFICRKSFDEPIVTLCKHYFCLGCAMDNFKTTPKCYICRANTRGVFNPAKKIIARITPGGNDGIDTDKVGGAFGELPDGFEDKNKIRIGGGGDDSEDSEAERAKEWEKMQAGGGEGEDNEEEKPKPVTFTDIKRRAFRTRGLDKNDDTEVAIINELELESKVQVRRDMMVGGKLYKRQVRKAVVQACLEAKGEKMREDWSENEDDTIIKNDDNYDPSNDANPMDPAHRPKAKTLTIAHDTTKPLGLEHAQDEPEVEVREPTYSAAWGGTWKHTDLTQEELDNYNPDENQTNSWDSIHNQGGLKRHQTVAQYNSNQTYASYNTGGANVYDTPEILESIRGLGERDSLGREVNQYGVKNYSNNLGGRKSGKDTSKMVANTHIELLRKSDGIGIFRTARAGHETRYDLNEPAPVKKLEEVYKDEEDKEGKTSKRFD